MKTSMNLLLWTTHVTAEHLPLLERLRATGFQGVEIPIFEGDEGHYRMLGQQLKRIGLGCTAVTVMTPETNPVSPDTKVQAAALAHLKWAIEMAQAMGAEMLCGPLHSALGHFTGTGPTADEKAWCADVLRLAAEIAQQANLRLAIEYLNRFECYFLTTAADTKALVQAVDHPHCKLMYDTFHANIEEKQVGPVIDMLGTDLIHVHVSENDRGTPGTGHVPWMETFQALRRNRYDGWLTIEAFGRALPALAAATKVWRDLFPTPEEVYVRGLDFMNRLWTSC
jgi:D-psicose/D-tagatose/L-ribulose 3-epimerase